MPSSRRTLPRRHEDGGLQPPEGEQARPLASSGPAVTPAQVLALQRSGAGNRLLARVLTGDGAAQEEELEEEAAEPEAEPEAEPAKPAAKASHEKSIDELMAEFDNIDAAKGPPPKKSGAATAPRAKKKSAKQKQTEKEQKAKQTQRQLEDAARDRAAEGRQAEARQKETEARAALTPMLTHARATLQGLRNALPRRPAYRDIRDDADAGLLDLDTFLKGPAKTAQSSEMQARLDSVNKLISKVGNFSTPETPKEKRARKFDEVKTNVPLAMHREEWVGPYGGETDFSVDKHDNAMRNLIVNWFGRDAVVIPGHATRDYKGKTATSEVRYYVTGTSKTASIAYDISLHVFDRNDAGAYVRKGDTVHVLHIPHEAE
jgi:chemotaxis protein histidine kinase CheA